MSANYLSIHRDDAPRPFGEDLIVRQVWWRMEYPAVNDDRSDASVGKLRRSLSKCAKAIGPYSSERWKKELLQAEQLGAEVEVSRPREAKRPVPKQQLSRRT